MDIDNLRLAILNLQQSVAILQLEKQKILVVSAEAEQVFAREIESVNTARDSGVETGKRIASLSERISKNQVKISSIDKKYTLN